MLIFFGVSSPKIGEATIRENTTCDHCGTEKSFKAIVHGSYFHFFWIPIISLGKSIELTCKHCKKRYDNNEIPNNLREPLKKAMLLSHVKTPKWHSFGCFTILFLFVLPFIITFFSLIFGFFQFDDEDSLNETSEIVESNAYQNNLSEDSLSEIITESVPKWKKEVKRLMDVSVPDPSILKDPISYSVKECVESKLKFLEEYSINYTSKVKEDKILILLESGDYKNYSEKQKMKLYSEVSSCVKNALKDEWLKPYLGIYKGDSFYMQQSPIEKVTDSIALKSEVLKEFFE